MTAIFADEADGVAAKTDMGRVKAKPVSNALEQVRAHERSAIDLVLTVMFFPYFTRFILNKI
ncbi:MAG TPA: hypothetical protein VFN25_12115 [Dokdonella sp.]|uniref:hypothetical protein n=1 Tax=Dokdonella sp. TaxID=2291710 RepID=UPI002D7E2C14|nr:hypothetical protein [Dokdonella sp.]HET9033636.1 hypothetical protein [Dokdonella sp.]